MEDDFLSVELLIHKNIEVVLLFLDIDWDIHTVSADFNWDRLRIVLILEEESKVLTDRSQFQWYEGELNLCARVPINLSGSFKRDLG